MLCVLQDLCVGTELWYLTPLAADWRKGLFITLNHYNISLSF